MSKKTIQSLEKLNKLKRFQLDEKRQALLAMQAKLQEMNQEVKKVHQQIMTEIDAAREEPYLRLNLPSYLQSLRKLQDQIKKEVFRLADFMVPVEASVRDAYKEVKALEMTIKSMQDKLRYEAQKKEQAEMDELFQDKKRKSKQ